MLLRRRRQICKKKIGRQLWMGRWITKLLRRRRNNSEAVVLAVGREMETLMDRVQRQFEAIRYAEFVEDIVQMVFHRLLTDEHLLGHFLILVALRDKLNDLAFPGAERRPLTRLTGAAAGIVGRSKLAHHGRGGVRVQPDFAAV